MGFTLPKHLKDFLKKFHHLADTYKEERKNKDGERYFNLFRSATKNPQREQDAEFIENLAIWVDNNRSKYSDFDPDFTDADYGDYVAPFLKKGVSGMLLLELIKIYGLHGERSTNSVMGSLIMEQFSIKVFKDAPSEQVEECIQCFNQLINVMKKYCDEDWFTENYPAINLAIADTLNKFHIETKTATI